jgi:allantoinase
MREQWLEGAPGFKAFMPFSEPAYPHVNDAEFVDGMREAAALGALVLVHAENDAILQANLKRLAEEGRHDPLAHHESRPPFVEEEAVHRALFLAAHAGVRIQIVHVSSPRSAELVGRAKANGQPASMEICPHHLLLDLDDLIRLGPYGRCAPALRERQLVEELWTYVKNGVADSLVSDHCAYTTEEKEPGWEDIFAAPLGCQVMQETVPLVLDEAIHRRELGLEAFVRFSSTNAARIIGLYPAKGTIRAGSDADLAIYDLDTDWVVDARSQQFSKNPWSPFDGRRSRVKLVRTIVRGETVYADGEIHVDPGYGRFLSSQELDAATAAGLELTWESTS